MGNSVAQVYDEEGWLLVAMLSLGPPPAADELLLRSDDGVYLAFKQTARPSSLLVVVGLEKYQDRGHCFG